MRGFTLLAGAAAVLLALPSAAAAQIQVTTGSADLKIGGRLHAQYKTSSEDGADSQFFLRRARLKFDITVNDIWSARIQPEMSGGSMALQDAYVMFAPSEGFDVSIGQFKREFDLFELVSSTQLSLIERDGRVDGAGSCAGVGGVCSYSRLVEKLNFAGRDQGLRFRLDAGPLELSASVTNGTGINTSDENDGKSFAGRAAFGLGESLTIAGGVAVHDYPLAGETEYANAWNVDVEYGTWTSGPHLQAAWAGGDNWKVDENTTFSTWQVAGTWFFPSEGTFSGFEPVFRISQGDPDTDLADDGGLVWTPGFMVYLSGRNKFGFNVDLYEPETGDSATSFKFQSFLYF